MQAHIFIIVINVTTLVRKVVSNNKKRLYLSLFHQSISYHQFIFTIYVINNIQKARADGRTTLERLDATWPKNED